MTNHVDIPNEPAATAPSTCPKRGYCAVAKVIAEWQFHIPRQVVSLNARGTNRGDWRKINAYRADRKAWAWWMRSARGRDRIPGQRAHCAPKRRLTLTRLWGSGQRAYDHDNLVGGMNLIVDAMVSEDLLAGDSPADVEVYYQQRKAERGEMAGLLVHLEQLA